MSEGIEIFICYAREDRVHKDDLVKYIKPLKRDGRIRDWHDGLIEPGADWQPEIAAALERCHMALLLISADFLNSEFIYSVELKRLFERRRDTGIRIVPIIVRPCLWKEDKRLKGLQAMPQGDKAIIQHATENGDRAQVWTNIVEYLAEYAWEVSLSPTSSSE
uniref:TIR domain-containing protein n=1 Tax=Candidatus Kentrum sp. FM TaxID=2126340 RepID=A0A450VL19_9GAMM|nr:MAG: TIR domain-containing protein [Candidatus Kentron sp. FM]VFJ43321.1 MAG: TIR domain-containing protein [Candidatus Kentron sp. FM]VFK05488.1 MAG: TIR domain-containing protein [Candidatus Kentron sp. FM]